jgi:hypothetical protein
MAQGEAAGTLAAMAVGSGCAIRDVPIRELRNRLIDQGAEIGDTLGEPDAETIERIGVLPKHEPPSSGESDPVSVLADAWVR